VGFSLVQHIIEHRRGGWHGSVSSALNRDIEINKEEYIVLSIVAKKESWRNHFIRRR